MHQKRLHLENIPQHRAAGGFLLGLQLIVGQGVGDVQLVVHAVQQRKVGTQGQGVEEEIGEGVAKGQRQAQHGQQYIPIGQNIGQQGEHIVPPEAEVQPEEAEAAAPHHHPALPHGVHGPRAGVIQQHEVRHPVFIQHGHSEGGAHDQENDDQRRGGTIQRPYGAVVQLQGGAGSGEQAAAGDQRLQGGGEGIGQGRGKENQGGKVAGADSHGGEDGPLQQLQSHQGPEAFDAGFQGIPGGVLAPADAEHAAGVAEAQAQGYQHGDHRQKVDNCGEKGAAAHIGKPPGVGNLAGNQGLQHQAQAADAQGDGAVEQDDFLLLRRVLKPCGCRLLQFTALKSHRLGPPIDFCLQL